VGAHDCVVKPFDADELRARVEALVARGRVAVTRETSLAQLDRAFHAAPAPMALVSPEGRFVRVNRALCSLLGFGASQLLARSVEELTHPADVPDEPAPRRGTRRLARADGSYLRVSAKTTLVGDDDGLLLWHLSEATDERHVHSGAGVLTGPPGRRAFERAVRHQLLRCRRYGEQAALVRCSLQSLPEVRAVHGTEMADALVAAILDAVRRRLRSTDVVAYLGEDEIAAVLAHADLDAASITADAMREAAESQRVDGRVGTDAEVGVASLVRAGSPGRAFVDAGLALQAKEEDAPRLRRFQRAREAGEAQAR
jgi:diguanylate cyclase (GGDEF)-like protein/PAS domain S-box-containing protein